ncbi:linear amide C-N hydrolase [Paenibacillus sp. IHBB 3054]|uniref:linear amide C-N hydrolase n=1 Tax=Paenibacillus sp. IHBB 3054 TaxID=3425689 RepID=UPI003F675788
MSTAIYFGGDGTRLLAKNQDIPYAGVYIFTNKRGVAKSALVQPPNQPAKWISRYGSLTVSQVGKEMPNCGFNEAGLVVEQTTLWQSTYSNDEELPAIGELQWIQMLLDTCATVKEAELAASLVRIVEPMSRLHYMIADRTGDCAIFEFIDGTMRVYKSDSLPFPIMANTPYSEAIRDLEDVDECWRGKYSDYEYNSMERFVEGAAYLTGGFPAFENDRLKFMLETLQAVRRKDTAFSLIYDLQQMQLHFTSSLYPELKAFRLSEVDFSVHATTMALNLQQPAGNSGDICYVCYDAKLNYTVANAFFRDPALTSAFGWNITDEMINFFAAFPDRFPSNGKR